ncbi:unnamed protein product [Haemonchus placei]|uniref:Uncharacterized protein n=1 Tax=Haemonchus placei TaxID=6290 RepID=A0A0N4VWP8_HAEPC|nr:unnamed protein product [Haemonchus placei]
MFNRTKSKNFRVEVLVPSSRRKARMAKHPDFRKRPRVTRMTFLPLSSFNEHIQTAV